MDTALDSLIAALPRRFSIRRLETQPGFFLRALVGSIENNASPDSTGLLEWSSMLDQAEQEFIGHTQRVTRLTLKLARYMGLPESELQAISHGAILHDIGKMDIPRRILLKPGPLTAAEWKIMHRHPVTAYELLSKIPSLHSARDIPYYHHEKWDGSGYPQQVSREAIPLSARIFATIDVWDALTSDRPYRPAWPVEQAIEYIRLESGRHFDPQVSQAFLQLIETGSFRA